MSIFSGGRQVAVDSVVYNMAGAEEDRPDYLKSLVVGNVLSGTKDSIAQSLQNGYLKGPSAQYRQFYRWASKPENYGLIGLPTGSTHRMNPVSSSLAQIAFARIHGGNPWVQRAQVGEADYGIWVEQWILANAPYLTGVEWTADFRATDGYIRIFQGSTAVAAFAPANFDPAGHYVYAWYNEINGGSVSPVTTGSWVSLGTGDFPDMTGWSYEGESTVGMTTTTIYSRMSYSGSGSGGAIYLRETRYLKEVAGPPVDRSYRTDTQSYTGLVHEQTQVFIYKLGSGDPDLDALIVPESNLGEFFPFIPVRLNNLFLSETYLSSEYAQCKKAYRKATGSSFDDLVDKISDNPSLGDIDHAYVAFGVSLNVIENACRRYLYRFFQRLQETQVGGPATYAAWKTAMEAQVGVFEIWQNWKMGQSNSENGLYGMPEPPRPLVPNLPTNEIRIAGAGSGVMTHYDMRISWLYIVNGTGTGKAKTGAKKGEIWFETLAPDTLISGIYGGGGLSNITTGRDVGKVRLYWQETNTTYRYLDIVGLNHTNYVYGNKAVMISAAQALADTDESGFIVPLHYDIWREISLVQGTQMATASAFLVFNCYKIRKAKWYERGIFQILIVIAIAILSVVFTGGAGIGLLGAHMAVGSALGLTGITAAIVGSIANAFAAMILSSILQQFGTALFGEQFGAFFAALVMFVMGPMITNFQATGSFAVNWSEFLKVDNLLKLTNVIGQGVVAHINQGTVNIGLEMQDYKENAKLEAEKIQQAFFDEFGYGAGRIDPLMFVDVASASRVLAETSDTFLTRTLMTGSDIAELSRDLIYNFAEYSTKLPDAFV